MRFLTSFIALTLLANFAFAQQQQPSDSLATLKKNIKPTANQNPKLNKNDSLKMVFQPIPKRAALYSAVCPGLGQIYNRRYWKAPIVYAAIGTAGYFIYINYTGYKSVYNGIARLQDKDPSNDKQPIIVRDFNLKKYDLSQTQSEADLLTVKKYFRQNLDVSFIAATVVYILNIVDANVDAHLYSFRIKDDVVVAPIANQNGMGFAVHW